ncbi:hypothetical protein F383_21033 [Gossypium arboreum]|uniref:Uncharacterized protein n=1 Tax=Gossypium arboreum TaxID=29729 RepID=A0A0B0P4Q8_GOSAR|nr:hypothetical protein F383_21033 [Gossypium arboreum]
MSGTWHLHRYDTSWKTIVGLLASIYDPIIPSGSTGSPRTCQRNDEYRQANSGIKERRRPDHSINGIFWV